MKNTIIVLLIRETGLVQLSLVRLTGGSASWRNTLCPSSKRPSWCSTANTIHGACMRSVTEHSTAFSDIREQILGLPEKCIQDPKTCTAPQMTAFNVSFGSIECPDCATRHRVFARAL